MNMKSLHMVESDLNVLQSNEIKNVNICEEKCNFKCTVELGYNELYGTVSICSL